MQFTRIVVGVLTCYAFATQLAAQSKPPTLDQILTQLQSNLDRYDTSVPSFFADEHVVSQVTPGRPSDNTVTDSIFRLKREVNRDHSTTLDESREVRFVNGHSASGHGIDGPTVISGAFEGGLAIVSVNQRVCMNYSLEHAKRKDPAAPYIVRFASVLTPQNRASCLLQEEGKGRVIIDPGSMQIKRLELNTPRHTIIPGSAYSDRISGQRLLTVEYAPVQLDAETFWLPDVIESRATSGAGTFHAIVWSFRATYHDFHRLEVKSRLLPAGQ